MEAVNKEIVWVNCSGQQIYTEQYIPRDSMRLGLVLLHEGLGAVSLWKDFPRKLALCSQSRVLAYDRPGYGKSSRIALPWELNFLQKEADEILPCIIQTFFNDLPYVLWGHSDGGSIALAAAGVLEPRPKALILEAPHVMIEEQTLKGVLQIHALRNDLDFIYRLTRHHGDKTMELLNGWLGVWMQPQARQWNIFDRLSLIDCPILFIQGSDDDFGTLRQWKEIRNRVKGRTESFILEGCGHIPHQCAEQKVLETAIQFIKTL